jgi:hypothetical protein
LNAPLLRGLAWFVWLVVGVAGWYVIVYPNAKPPTLAFAALGYVLLLASTAGCASGLALVTPAFFPLACGAALFFVSDLMIAAGQFAGFHFPLIESAIWLTYGPAQMLIVYSTAAALAMTQCSHATPATPQPEAVGLSASGVDL